MISVIIPVYHSFDTLEKCLFSVLRQSYNNFQVIVVIDGVGGEQDKSIDLCQSVQRKDKRVKVIIQDNTGVDRARFAGLRAVDGDYVTFVDADDWLDKDALSTMMFYMANDNYDYVEVSSNKCLGPIKRMRNLPLSGSISFPELFEKYYMSFFGWNVLPVSIWGKLYRRETIERAELTPSGFAMGEDLIFNMKLFPYLKKIYLIDKPLYNYRFGGMTSRYNPHLLKDLKAQFLLKLDSIEKYSYHKADNPVRIEMVNALHSDIKQRIIYQDNQTMENVVEAISKEIREEFWREVLNITNGYLDSSPFYIALKNCDAEAIYTICKKEVDSTRVQRACKRVASRILSII